MSYDATMLDAMCLALQAPRWALSYVARHAIELTLVAAFPAIQRAVWVLWGPALPGLVNTLLDLLTLAFRFLLIGMVFHAALAESGRLAFGDAAATDDVWRHMVAFVQHHRGSLVIQVALFGLCIVATNGLLSVAASALTNHRAEIPRDLVTFVVRNMLIIPVAVAWLGGVVYVAVVHGE